MKAVYKDNVIEALYYLADYNFQKQAWLSPGKPFASNFIEDVWAVFEDSSLIRALDDNDVVFGQKADQALRDLYRAVRAINNMLPESVIINLPQMRVVRKKAITALKLVLKSATTDETTVQIFLPIYIAVNGNNGKGLRPALAQELPGGLYKVWLTEDYIVNKNIEKGLTWQFSEGDIVRCQKKYVKGSYYLLAVAKA